MTFPLMPMVVPSASPGETWTTGTFPAGHMGYSIAVNPSTGRWVCVGFDGLGVTAVYSDNGGSTWTKVSVSNFVYLESVAYGGGLFVASESAGDRLYSSPDGITWTLRISGSSRDHHKITYNDGYFVMGSGTGGGNGYIYGSSNGTTWTYGPQGAVGANSVQCGIYVAALGRTFAAGNQWKYVNAVPTSATAWTGTPTGLSGIIYGVTWSPDLSLAVAVGSAGIFTSTNLTSWTSRSTGDYRDVIWTGDQFVAVGSGLIATSPDGITWTSRTPPAATTLVGVESYDGTLITTASLSSTYFISQ